MKKILIINKNIFMANSTNLNLLGEIVSVLAENNSYWSLCGGAQNRTGLTDEEILSILLTHGPHWDLILVQQILKFGLKMGTLRQQRTGPDCLTGAVTNGEYFINANMLFENNANNYFKTLIPGLNGPKIFSSAPLVRY